MLYYLLTTLYIIVCLLLLLVILLQQGKGGDMASAFGGGSSQTAFGARTGATLLTKLTTGFAVALHAGRTRARGYRSARAWIGVEQLGTASGPGETGAAERSGARFVLDAGTCGTGASTCSRDAARHARRSEITSGEVPDADSSTAHGRLPRDHRNRVPPRPPTSSRDRSSTPSASIC